MEVRVVTIGPGVSVRLLNARHAEPPGSATDAVTDVGGLRCVDHPDDLQLDTRPQQLEQPVATAEQHPPVPHRAAFISSRNSSDALDGLAPDS
jgi:hypothetical protein